MKIIQIAHYGGYLLAMLDKYSRRQLKHITALKKKVGAGNTLLNHRNFRTFCVSEWLLNAEQRHIDSWKRLIWATKLSRRAKAVAA